MDKVAQLVGLYIFIFHKMYIYIVSFTKDNKNFFETKNNWSLIKDKLLGCYLMPYFQKVLTTGKKICYVDCFSGKGKFEDGEPESPIIALKIREQCLQKTKSRIDISHAIEMTFIDLNYAEDLKKNLQPYDNIYGKPQIISGKYEEQILKVLQDKQGYNVFLYIDPYGIKALNTELFDQFERLGFHSFEMLINFNSFGFFRDACRVMNVDYKRDEAFQNLEELVEFAPTTVNASEQSALLLSSIAGGDYWKNIVVDYKEGKINGYQAEQRLSTEYKVRLKERYTYVLDMPIRLKSGQRPKYRMIHVSDHEDGCYLMAQNMQSRKDELYTNIQQEGQLSLFDMMNDYKQSAEGDWITKDEVREKIKTCLVKCQKEINITRFLAFFTNENGLICDFREIYDILSEFESSGFIEIRRIPEKTITGKKSSFWDENKEHKVILRRING